MRVHMEFWLPINLCSALQCRDGHPNRDGVHTAEHVTGVRSLNLAPAQLAIRTWVRHLLSVSLDLFDESKTSVCPHGAPVHSGNSATHVE